MEILIGIILFLQLIVLLQIMHTCRRSLQQTKLLIAKSDAQTIEKNEGVERVEQSVHTSDAYDKKGEKFKTNVAKEQELLLNEVLSQVF